MRYPVVVIALVVLLTAAAGAEPRALVPGAVQRGTLVAAKPGEIATERWTLAAKKGERWVFSVRGENSPPTLKVMEGTKIDAVPGGTGDPATATFVTRYTSRRTITIDVEAAAEGSYEIRADAWTGNTTVHSMESYSGTTFKGSLDKKDPQLGGRAADTWELVAGREDKTYSVKVTASSPVEVLVGTVDRGYKGLIPLREGVIGTSVEVNDRPSGPGRSVAVTVRASGASPVEYQIKVTEISAPVTEAPPPGAGTLARGKVVSGELGASDLKDLEGQPYDLWAFEMVSGDTVTAVVRADMPDGVYLRVGKMSPSDATKLSKLKLPENGYARSDTGDASVTVKAPVSGIYVVVVVSNTLRPSGMTGRYTLSISGANDIPSHPALAQRAKTNPVQLPSPGPAGGGESGGSELDDLIRAAKSSPVNKGWTVLDEKRGTASDHHGLAISFPSTAAREIRVMVIAKSTAANSYAKMQLLEYSVVERKDVVMNETTTYLKSANLKSDRYGMYLGLLTVPANVDKVRPRLMIHNVTNATIETAVILLAK